MRDSKYWKKTHEEVEYDLEDYTCPKCDKVFMIDLAMCRNKYVLDLSVDMAVIHCPYCGKIFRLAY